jgi:imidazolonepropionase-like amidohydrolase
MPKAEQKLKADLVIENASELCTVASRGTGKEKGLPLPLVGRSAGDIGVIKNGFVAAARGKIIAVGSKAILKKIDARDAVVFNATGKTVLPGFVDCHTHLVFAGSRENELEQKALGASYFEILKRGGGILSTVRSTRRASKQELVRLAGKTLDRMLSFGTTTVEAKSGYGLDLKTELKILQATRELREKRKHAVDVVPTFLGAHAVPPGFASAEFADEVIRMLPRFLRERRKRFFRWRVAQNPSRRRRSRLESEDSRGRVFAKRRRGTRGRSRRRIRRPLASRVRGGNQADGEEARHRGLASRDFVLVDASVRRRPRFLQGGSAGRVGD